ncbi:MAG: dihydrolipoyl dehydrogenase family protein [Alkalibacterium gilvum]|uniref:Glutathione reductase (NADPH) n=1 Tax=Alkalibacterium gilvum TaxID=1130080 RepID=A0A1H6R7W9_9LACT|nr:MULTISPECIES: NAD(P)/FAD-dependent oxidoreductase [Alkalibacterium]MDN6293111.1 NAD(P)/FAD-dependent oxidoreductase [Alkalibacterium sp.]MDN6294770.1 NAD(P)/FAD-dependent oxidoreductase [Alkalibacterium sp.]MDN6397560.1 NAD(P)/FAD-dependent oxidoreductase [Alkalibacterium sp.]MDN6728562.1 NAD(P)/FAD-dependent oxidoreductase [Alkalibacterium sp.]SEI48617.1 glutathione reductase (NADPH) [Alkalibacterium gilvum]
MTHSYDVVVIGSGPAGKSAASSLASKNNKVAVIENDLWGGTCPNRGCDPKKVLVSAVESQTIANQLSGKGIKDTPTVNWTDLMTFKKTFTDPVSEQSKKSLDSSGADTYYGTAEFIDEKSLKVNNNVLEADRFIIATGAHPNILNIKGKEHFLTSNDFLSLPDMPDTITFIGGGYISFEFAAIASAAGAKVNVIQYDYSPLKQFDQEFVKEVMKELEAKGVTFHLNTNVTEIKKESGKYTLTGDNNFSLQTDLVFSSTGRAPSIDKLNLDKANVPYDKKGVKVNDYLQTSNPSIYAIGDALSKNQPKLTPVSSLEASYIVEHFSSKENKKIVYPSVPSIVFTSPKLAHVGVTIKEATEDDKNYDINEVNASKFFSYKRTNEPVSKVKVVTDKHSGQLVGATCINNEADELINYFSILINKKIKADELSELLFAYPTIASDLPYFYK